MLLSKPKKLSQGNLEKVLDKLQSQFLSCFPVSKIDWNEIPSYISWNQQQQIIDRTYKHPLNLCQPIKRSYALCFLKKLLKYLGNHGEIHDVVYESYCDAQLSNSKEEGKYAYKHYMLPVQAVTFSMRESKSFVAEGTTGLCSWQASLALADYFLHHPEIVRDKNVIELGSGTGLCGFIMLRCCATRQLMLTDGSSVCVDLMRYNFRKNFDNAEEVNDGVYKLGEQRLELREMCWDEVEEVGLMDKIKPDLVVAADVIYDSSVFTDLIHAIDFIFTSMENKTKMLLSTTVRNEETLNQFLYLLDRFNFKTAFVDPSPPTDGFLHWDRTTPIKIFEITRT